ncbi:MULTISPECIES: helix-turn-helix transcriptional regulator [unclassified Pseudomonas]|uniref:helix-turn-helix domain-containing protein n=1 Tax=unclassified Pseudomonas TaxID=196821 RepID=UPI002AC8AF15|nr:MULTISPECIES: helix-turn-helix transcriptional regulator [unclassified Pseudomonas]MEB0041214.1 helix-turn-helix transcriptional regulator [Pseudomonas sp. MH10]MEB0078303.1 helix-turn-helix transcriptional regulator [Pseudomonas sp. MH10out]MEB0092264.1 helix-turn-helix transcriptional regulator [Pseudomonas sp. CCI4.2]MEB0101757.1 helix-turn-helix transcriptional regulator [Pseudomonas sp. CCI3.2]MEB0123341.1 helix-turn-helix transcriptional regulator [Pseudomonas sp. CCI1.2]
MHGMSARLKEERKRLGLSQQALATIGEIEPNAQGMYERGARFPNATYLSSVAKAGVDILFVVTGVKKVRPTDSMTIMDTKVLHELDGLPKDVQDDIKKLISTLFEQDSQE